MSLYEGSVKRPIMTTLVFIAIAVLGLYSYTRLPIDLLPDIESNTIMVFTSYSGASASDIENNVTRPLENTLNSCSYIKHISSKSSEGTSVITLEFEYGHDIDDLTNNVRDRLNMISSALPDGATTPVIFKFDTNMMPIMLLSVQASESQSALYKILDEYVANPLARIPGVGTVSVGGAPQREIYVYCDPAKLEAYGLTIEQIAQVIANENRDIPSGNINIGNESFALRVEGEFDDPMDMKHIVLASVGGRNIYLDDVAKITDTTQERAQEAYNNNVRGAMITIQKQTGANTVQICRKVKSALPQIEKTLPSDVRMDIIMDSSIDIIETVNSLSETIIYAILFVALVVFFFTGRWRATIVVILTIPLSLIAAFIYMAIAGASINVISLSSLIIAVGLVVDDAIVVLENVTTHIERGSDPKQAAIHATNEVAISVIASTLTMLAVFFPLTMIGGMTGVMFRQFGWMLCVILTVSTVSALSFTPMICSRMLKLEKKHGKFQKALYSPIQKFLDLLDKVYYKIINWSVRHRKTVVIGFILLFVISILPIKNMKSEFFPSDEQSRITVSIYMPISTNVDRSREVASELAQLWMERYKEDLRVCNFRVGTADESNTLAAMQSNGDYIISMNLSLPELDERSISSAVMVEELRADLAQRPEIERFMVTAGGGMSMGSQSSVKFEIYGYDFDNTDKFAKEFMAKMKNVPGAGECYVSRDSYQPEYHIEFDREKLAQHGLNLATAATYLRNRIYGAMASYYREDGEEYKIMVRYAPEFRQDISDIENILLYGTGNNAVRVRDVGQVVESFTPPSIERKDRQRINTVTCVVANGYALSDIVSSGQAVLNSMDMPDGITVQIAGDYEEQQDSFKDMALLAALIMMLVFIVMAAQFESLSLPFIIMFSIPFAVSGVLLGLSLTGTSLNVMSILGAIMLMGIVVKNGIVLIDYTKLCCERGLSAITATVTAGRSRLRPVLMTSLTTILGMIPMAVDKGQGSAMWRPLGVSVIGGLSISTLITLVIVPVLFCIMQGFQFKKSRKKYAKQLELSKYWEANKSDYIHDKTAKIKD